MKKIKIISLLCALLIFVLVFSGCGKTTGNDADVDNSLSDTQVDNTDNKENEFEFPEFEVDTTDKEYITSKESFVDKMSELLDMSLYGELNEHDYTSHMQYTYEIKDRIEYDMDCSVKFSDGTQFTMPLSLEDFIETGWTLDSSIGTQSLNPNLMTDVTMQNSSGNTLEVTVCNTSDTSLTIKECDLMGIASEQYVFGTFRKVDGAVEFVVCDTLNNASTLEDIIKKLGNPTYIDYKLYRDADGNYDCSALNISYQQKDSIYSHLDFFISADGNYIMSMDYTADPT